MNEPTEQAPSRIPWPPLLVGATLIAGLLLDTLTHDVLSGLVSFRFAQEIGGAIIVLAFANDVWCARTLARHKTTILPHRAASQLVTDGPYRWSRNPIYVSHVAVVIGLGLLLQSPFVLLLAPIFALALVKFSIEPEERHLLRKFGDDYRSYMARARRWV